MGLFSGLEKFGLGKLEKMDVFEEEKKRDAVEHPKKDQKPQIQEEDLLFDKSFTCFLTCLFLAKKINKNTPTPTIHVAIIIAKTNFVVLIKK